MRYKKDAAGPRFLKGFPAWGHDGRRTIHWPNPGFVNAMFNALPCPVMVHAARRIKLHSHKFFKEAYHDLTNTIREESSPLISLCFVENGRSPLSQQVEIVDTIKNWDYLEHWDYVRNWDYLHALVNTFELGFMPDSPRVVRILMGKLRYLFDLNSFRQHLCDILAQFGLASAVVFAVFYERGAVPALLTRACYGKNLRSDPGHAGR